MNYSLLYEAWKREKQDSELQPLNRGFYSILSQYVRNNIEEVQLLDEKTLKAQLLTEENEKIKKILTDLVVDRFNKIYSCIIKGKSISPGLLTSEEEYCYNSMLSAWRHIEKIVTDVLKGKPLKKEQKSLEKPKKILVRFLKAIPAIVGSDMKAYGPFKKEDVATIPIENAEVLIKRGVVMEIDIS